MTIKIKDKNKTMEIIRVDIVDDVGTKIKDVDKAVDAILYQMIQDLQARVAVLESRLK